MSQGDIKHFFNKDGLSKSPDPMRIRGYSDQPGVCLSFLELSVDKSLFTP